MKSITIRIKDQVDISFAQTESLKVVDTLGFDLIQKSKIRTIISELAFNIIKYAKTGTIKVSTIVDGSKSGVLIEALDRGPGINDINKALEDSYSTGGTLGLGLPGIKRIADELNINTSKENGTHVSVKYLKHK
jgi:serine/threonine-protein kinase RsbT